MYFLIVVIGTLVRCFRVQPVMSKMGMMPVTTSGSTRKRVSPTMKKVFTKSRKLNLSGSGSEKRKKRHPYPSGVSCFSGQSSLSGKINFVRQVTFYNGISNSILCKCVKQIDAKIKIKTHSLRNETNKGFAMLNRYD